MRRKTGKRMLCAFGPNGLAPFHCTLGNVSDDLRRAASGCRWCTSMAAEREVGGAARALDGYLGQTKWRMEGVASQVTLITP